MTFVSLKGVSRHSASLGPWKVYADNDVDNSPLDMTTKKRSLHDHQQEAKNEESESEKRRRIANIRFTGKNENYSSRASHTIFEVGIKHSISNEPDSGNASVTVRFEGADISSGIYKLALEGVVEPQRMPRWLTGEYGVTSGIVEDGHFSPS
jgi:central kinetochore subunit Mis15/CHL4